LGVITTNNNFIIFVHWCTAVILFIMTYRFIKTDYLETVTGGDKEILKEIVELFRSQVVEFHDDMRRLYSEKSYENLGLLAHKAKSSVAIMGMDDLAQLLKTFELEAKKPENVHLYQSYIDRFASDTAEAVKELDHFLNE